MNDKLLEKILAFVLNNMGNREMMHLNHYIESRAEFWNKIQSLEKELEKLRAERAVMVDCLQWIAKTDTASHVYGPDVIWLSDWRNTRKAAASNTLKQIGEIE